MPTCLFTGEILSANTKPEHAILRALGGRITSTQLTSSTFNTNAGMKIDFFLAEQFMLIVRELAPLLVRELRKNRLKLSSEDGERSYYKQGGVVTLAKPYLTRDSITKKTICLIPDSEDIKVLAESEHWDLSKAVKTRVLPPDKIVYTGEIANITIEGHIATLKCVLCAFDAMEQQERIEESKRFTRHFKLSALRNLITEFVMNDRRPKPEELNGFFLGIQPNKNKFDEILKYYHLNPPPYSHVLIVSTNTTTKTIDCLWNILGIEIHGLRLAYEWDGPSFLKIIICPVINTNMPIMFQVHEEIFNPICEITKYKAFYFAKSPEQAPESDVIPYISESRKMAYKDAVVFIEMNADKFVLENFECLFSTISAESTLADAVSCRLEKLFTFIYPDSELKKLVQKDNFSYLAKWDRYSLTEFSNVDKKAFLFDYRQAFSSLCTPFHLPGYIFTKSVRIETTGEQDK